MNILTTDDGVSICKKIEEIVKPLRAHCAHCALTGSLIYRGESEKDADVIIYSHNAGDPYNKQEILEALSASFQLTAPPYQTSANYFNKDVVILDVADGDRGARIDLFFFP